MKEPRRINHLYYATILAATDFIIGALVYVAISLLYPQIHVIFPRSILPSLVPFWIETMVFALYWVILYALSGIYRQLGNQSIWVYTGLHFSATFMGMVFFTFFFFIKNESIFTSGFFHFFVEVSLITSISLFLAKGIYYFWTWHLMKNGKAAIHAILIGDTPKAETMYHEYSAKNDWTNYYFVGYVSTSDNEAQSINLPLNKLGSLEDLSAVMEKVSVDEAIVAIDNHDFKKIEHVLATIRHKEVTIKLLPDLSAILEGSVKTNNIKGTPLITINNRLMPVWQSALKWMFDIFISLFAILVFLPFFPFVAFAIKKSSPGKIFYFQRRIGKDRKPFKIIKFRSMYSESENDGPALSSAHDPRITPWGKVMRKWHIDEIPQFINVLKGDMSIVGPRPERKFFIDQILKIAPHYSHLLSVKPGITSWGMVKFGYAENVEQMVKRLEYDILYLENISLVVVLKIIAHTFKEIFKGKGK